MVQTLLDLFACENISHLILSEETKSSSGILDDSHTHMILSHPNMSVEKQIFHNTKYLTTIN